MNWIKLTDPAGEPVWINLDRVTKIQRAPDGEMRDEPSCQTRLFGERLEYVQESPEEIFKILTTPDVAG